MVSEWVCLEGKADGLADWTWSMAPSGGLQGGSKTSDLTVRMACLCAAEIGTVSKDRSPSYWTPRGMRQLEMRVRSSEENQG